MSKTIIWKRLVLRGFGRYRHGIEASFSPGLNHAVAANEYGKSTLVAGLAAVLFGLPNISDPARFGKAKYRNWQAAERFEGEVEFSVDEDTYRVQREFNTDRVSLARWQGNRWEELAGGEHRPGARRRNVVYEDQLLSLIGIASADLFWLTFCVGQPLPEPSQLSQSVQQLLSGSGSHGGQALEKLESWLGDKTKYTGRLGVSSRDKNKDRELEILLEEKQQLEQIIQDTASSVDSVHVLQEQIAVLEERKRETEELLRQKEDLHRDWVRWRSLRERYAGALQEQVRVKQAQDRAALLNHTINEANDEIKRQYPEFLTAPPDLEASLGALVRIEEDVQQKQEEIEKIREAIEEQEMEIKRLQEQLDGPLAPVVGRPHLEREHQELLQLLGQQQELQRRLTDLERQEEKARRMLAEVQNWGGLGEQPLAYYRQVARIALQKYEELQAMLQEQESIGSELAARYGLLHQGVPELAAACRDYYARKAALEQDHAGALTASRQASERLSRYREEKNNLERQFADLSDISSAAVSSLDTRLELERKKGVLEAELGSRPAGKGYLAGALLMLAGAAISLAAGQQFISLALLGVALAVGAYGFIYGHKGIASAERSELQQMLTQLAAVNVQLGTLAQCPLEELAGLRERLIIREQRRQELAIWAKNLPSEEEMAQLEEEACQAGEELNNFNRQLQPVVETLGDPQSAFYEWQNRKEAFSRLEQRLTNFAQKEYGVSPDMVDSLKPGEVEGWREVQVLAAVVGEDLENVGAAARWLAALPADCWATWQEEANRYQEAKASLHTCDLQRRELDPLDANGKSFSVRLGEAVARLHQAIVPFTETTPSEEIKQLLLRCSEVEHDLELTRRIFNNLQERLTEQEGKLKDLARKQESLTIKLADILASVKGQAVLAQERWQQWREMEADRQKLYDNLEGLLKGWDVSGLEELELKAIDANNTALQVRNEWQQLVESRPGLPGLEMRDQREQLETEYATLDRDRKQLQEQVKTLEGQIFEHNKELSSLMGREVVNIAAARERLADLEDECKRLELETEALALAYKELAQVRNLYNTTHRERLAAAASRYFAELTGSPGRQVTLDDEFQVKVAEPDGQQAEIAQLSQGAQDQLQVALRLAIADLVAGDYRLPLLFDDPFLNFDNYRLDQLQAALVGLAEQRQILVLSHRQEYEQWGLPVKLEALNHIP